MTAKLRASPAPLRAAIGITLGYAISCSAAASCGAGFCAANTDWNVQGAWVEPGVRVDLRTEYIDQDQPRAGTRRVGVGEIPRHHDEMRTISRNLLLAVDATLDGNWGASLTIPAVHRSHQHLHHHHGDEFLKSWDFRALGDVTVLGRYQRSPGFGNAVYGVRFGAKLPTGRTDVHDEGAPAEPSLQPGTGTVDGIIGVYTHRPFMSLPANWFSQAQYQRAVNEHNDYLPGYDLSADIGGSYILGARFQALLQVNALLRGKDRGAAAEPEDTGGRFLYVSPGLSFAPSPAAQLYALVQLPVYQRVNGVQLTADWALVAGLSFRF